MRPDERRHALVLATVPLLVEHGRAVSTKQIAQAAQVAEGTIFRAFANKDELIQAAIDHVFEPGRMLADLSAIDLDLDLRGRALELVEAMQNRFADAFSLLNRLGMDAAPQHSESPNARELAARTHQAMVAVLAPCADQLRATPDAVARLLRLLTFSGSHPRFSDGAPLSADEIVDTVLFGTALPTKDAL